MKIPRPSSLTKQSKCNSGYKSNTTLKRLVGIDPRGSIIIALMLFSGYKPDNDITSQSGILNLLKDLKTVHVGKIHEANRGRLIKVTELKKDIEQFGFKFNISTFAPASGKIKSLDVNTSEKSCYSSSTSRRSQSQS